MGNKNSTLNELKGKFQELEAYGNNISEIQMSEFQMQISDHFYSIKNDIDIKREILLQNFHKNKPDDTKFLEKVHQLSDNLIKSVESNEEEFCQNFNNEIKSYLDELRIEEEKKNLEVLEKNPIKNNNEMKKLAREFDKKLFDLKRKMIAASNKFQAKLKSNRFYEHHDDNEIHFGHLNLNNYKNELKKENQWHGTSTTVAAPYTVRADGEDDGTHWRTNLRIKLEANRSDLESKLQSMWTANEKRMKMRELEFRKANENRELEFRKK